MSTRWVSRRRFLALSLASVLAPRTSAFADAQRRQRRYTADVGIFYSLLTFRLPGTIEEHVDRAAGRYEITVVGQGNSIDNRLEATGSLVGGRWTPARSASIF